MLPSISRRSARIQEQAGGCVRTRSQSWRLVEPKLQDPEALEIGDGIRHSPREFVAVDSKLHEFDEVAELLGKGAAELTAVKVEVGEREEDSRDGQLEPYLEIDEGE